MTHRPFAKPYPKKGIVVSIDFRNLAASEEAIHAIASDVYRAIIEVSDDERGITKPTTGISVFVGERGTRNFTRLSIGKPSDAAIVFSIEKESRASALGHISSGNSRDPYQCLFAGSIAIPVKLADDTTILLFCSISGLREPEDAAGSIRVLSGLFGITPEKISQTVRDNRGALPVEISQDGHYLNKLLFPRS